MNRQKKYRAFSLVEVSIVLLLSTVVVSIAYTGLHIFSKTIHSYKTKQNNISDYKEFSSHFSTDWWQSSNIKRVGNTIVFYFPDETIIRYQFSKKKVVRSKNGANIIISTSASIHDVKYNEYNSIEEISIKVDFQKENLTLYEHKTYSITSYMNQ